MVFTSIINFVRVRGPDEFWRKRKIFKLSANYIGRRRNCYSITIKNVHRALVYATKGRKLKKLDFSELWNSRLSAGCEQYGISMDSFRESLIRDDVLLNKKMLSDLAIWEPKSFESLVNLARDRASKDGLPIIKGYSVIDQIYNLPLKRN